MARLTAPETILITGGAGTLGRTLAPLLIAGGSQVRLLDIVATQASSGAQAITGDLRDRKTVAGAMEGVDAVVHAAAWHGMHLREPRTSSTLTWPPRFTFSKKLPARV